MELNKLPYSHLLYPSVSNRDSPQVTRHVERTALWSLAGNSLSIDFTHDLKKRTIGYNVKIMLRSVHSRCIALCSFRMPCGVSWTLIYAYVRPYEWATKRFSFFLFRRFFGPNSLPLHTRERLNVVGPPTDNSSKKRNWIPIFRMKTSRSRDPDKTQPILFSCEHLWREKVILYTRAVFLLAGIPHFLGSFSVVWPGSDLVSCLLAPKERWRESQVQAN